MIYIAIFFGAYFRVALRVLAQHNAMKFRWKQTPLVSFGLAYAEIAMYGGAGYVGLIDGIWWLMGAGALIAVGSTLGAWTGMYVELRLNGGGDES